MASDTCHNCAPSLPCPLERNQDVPKPTTAALLLSLLAATGALAQSAPSDTPALPASPPAASNPAVNTPLATRTGFEIGGQFSDYEYKEPDFMKLSGPKLAVAGAYTFAFAEQAFGRAELRHAYGELYYEGSGTMNDVPDTTFEARFLVGGDFFPEDAVAVTPYAGLGYRYLFNDLRGTTSTGAVGYRRYSRYLYVPLGLTMRFRTDSSWVVAPSIEYDYFIRGQQDSRLSDTGFGLADAKNRQHEGYGYRAAVLLENGHFAFGPWVQGWKIEDSDLTPVGFGLVGLEPANETFEMGIELKYRF